MNKEEIQRKFLLENPGYFKNKKIDFKSEEYRKARRERWKRNKAKFNARNNAWLALKKGTLKKQPCIVCGGIKVQAHHEDYSKPLDVIWLCVSHHSDHHRKRIDITKLLV